VTSGERLCLACGLCCDGTLFDHVRLGPVDDAKKLKAHGLPVALTRSKPAVAHFPQPCAALCEDRTCRVYADRPAQCRIFECGVYKDALAERIPFPTALRLVKQARRRADDVRRLLRKLGDTDERRPLNERFQRTMRSVESGVPDEAVRDTFATLTQSVHRLTFLAHEKFYTRTPS